MTCIPNSGGCERWATDVLVNHINRLEGTHYEHRSCLDQLERERSQPECLYVNLVDHQALAIERKAITWPDGYAHQHSKDHELANVIEESLSDIDFQCLYALRMPSLHSVLRKDLAPMGQHVAIEIRSKYANAHIDQEFTIIHQMHTFRFGILPGEERDLGAPDKGLCFIWPLNIPIFGLERIQNELSGQIDKIYLACIRKFAEYGDARRILMLSPHGELTFMAARWWMELFKRYQPPSAVHEIWIVSDGVNEFGEEEWLIDKVFGGNLGTPELITLPIVGDLC